jgi:hypothetical protein
MPGVILHPGQSLDKPRDAGQRPEVRAEAMRPRALPQGRLDAAHLVRGQSRLAPGTAGAPQRLVPTLAPRAIPSHDALAADRQAPGNSTAGLSARGKQPSGPLAANCQSVEIPSGGDMSTHASILRWKHAICHHIMRDSVIPVYFPVPPVHLKVPAVFPGHSVHDQAAKILSPSLSVSTQLPLLWICALLSYSPAEVHARTAPCRKPSPASFRKAPLHVPPHIK